jgi:fibro-slime domain-containing protein
VNPDSISTSPSRHVGTPRHSFVFFASAALAAALATGCNGSVDPGAGDDTGDDDAPGSVDAGPGSGVICGELVATIRDFQIAHPDFEEPDGLSDYSYPGLVLPDLGADGKPVYAFDGPIEPHTTGPDEFNQWYNDVPGVNMALPYTIELTDQGNGVSGFSSSAFFPIDGKGFGNEGLAHNFHFTTEVHTTFEYKGGETFRFTGDDDLWLFINGKLAIDLGGLHPKLTGEVNLDEKASELGIEKGGTYKMDIFHAERHTDASNFQIETTIDCFIVG